MNDAAQGWALLPLVVGAALFRWRARQGRDALAALLEAAAAWVAVVWVGANLLSVCDGFRPAVLRGTWALAGAGAAVALWRTRSARLRWPRIEGVAEWSLVLLVGALLGVTLVRALASPPNTVDVLNYHLPRQLMWLQHGNLAPWPTVNDRQLMMPPLAEVIGAQFLGLTGGDYWANLPQWAAYAGLAVAIALLVRRLGGSRAAAGVAALLGLLLPMAYHEATNAKNDLLSAFWIVAGTAELARWREARFTATRSAAAWLMLPFTLAWLTKSTAMLFVPPVLVAGLWAWMRRTAWREQVRVFAPAALLALVLVAPFHARNLAWYGSPLGRHRAEDGGALAMETFAPSALASNALRHASLHLVSPSGTWNERWEQWIRRAHDGLGISLADPRTTLWNLPFELSYAPDNETTAGAPVHFLFGLPLLLWLALAARGSPARWLAAATLAGAALFCVALKWQPWATRLELPLFALGVAAVVAAGAAWSRGVAQRWGTAALVGAWAAWLPGADTSARPLGHAPSVLSVSREFNQYRFNLPRAQRDAALADLLVRSGARHISIYSVHDTPYVLMRRLQGAIPGVEFSGGVTPVRAPCDALTMLVIGAPLPLYAEWDGRQVGRLVGTGFGDGIYLPEARVRELGWWNRLPEMGGWARQEGLPRSGWAMPGWGPGVARWMPSGQGQIDYLSAGRRLQLRVALRRVKAERPRLELAFASEGKEFAVIDAGTEESVEFTVSVPSNLGVNRVVLRDNDAARGGYVFTRLQFNDSP